MADGGQGISASRLSNKKSFEYKMSKKVSELTQVVHMLFSRNHEREVELEATKAAYEQEIVNVIADARKRIEALEQRLAEEQRKAEAKAASMESKYEQRLHEQKKEAEQRLAEAKRLNEKSVNEIKNLKSEISNLEKEVERTKHDALRTHFSTSRKDEPSSPNKHQIQTSSAVSASDNNVAEGSSPRLSAAADFASLTELKEDVHVKEIEIENLKHLVAMHVQTQRESDAAIGQFRKDLDKTESELRLRIAQLIDDVTLANKAKERVHIKNKTLESDVKNLKRLMERNKKEAASDENKRRVSEASLFSRAPNSKSAEAEISSNAREEIERLRKEIKWYRMELSNREGNFNRMFADSNPIRLGGMSSGPSLSVARQRTDVGVIPNVGSFSSRSDDGSHKARSPPNRLPTLGMDGRQKDRDASRSKLGYNSGVGAGAGASRRSSVSKDKHSTPRKSITSGYI